MFKCMYLLCFCLPVWLGVRWGGDRPLDSVKPGLCGFSGGAAETKWLLLDNKTILLVGNEGLNKVSLSSQNHDPPELFWVRTKASFCSLSTAGRNQNRTVPLSASSFRFSRLKQVNVWTESSWAEQNRAGRVRNTSLWQTGLPNPNRFCSAELKRPLCLILFHKTDSYVPGLNRHRAEPHRVRFRPQSVPAEPGPAERSSTRPDWSSSPQRVEVRFRRIVWDKTQHGSAVPSFRPAGSGSSSQSSVPLDLVGSAAALPGSGCWTCLGRRGKWRHRIGLHHHPPRFMFFYFFIFFISLYRTFTEQNILKQLNLFKTNGLKF